jgi:hypothetical protein
MGHSLVKLKSVPPFAEVVLFGAEQRQQEVDDAA